jgi:DNA processing protein
VTAGDPACTGCLRRAALLARLAPNIERAAAGPVGGRSRDLLALDDDDLAAAVGGHGADLAPPGDADTTCRHRDAYPDVLHHLDRSAPQALWLLGDAGLLGRLEGEPAVTIVGSRRASAYGREVAYELGLLLAHAGIHVVSGMAHGIDAAAHRGALDAGGATVAVLGCGADVAYPAGQRGLYERIVENGLVVSEMPPGFKPFRWSFPARNRIMAALGRLTVVVEAAQRSGSLITVRIAQSLGRDVGAVPGPINSRFSRGSNALLADGAFPVLGAQSVLDELLGPGVASVERPQATLEPALVAILERIEAGERTPDAIARSTGLAPGALAAGLARLEMLGRVRADPAGRYLATGPGGRGGTGATLAACPPKSAPG